MSAFLKKEIQVHVVMLSSLRLLSSIKPSLVKKINRLPTPIAGLVSPLLSSPLFHPFKSHLQLLQPNHRRILSSPCNLRFALSYLCSSVKQTVDPCHTPESYMWLFMSLIRLLYLCFSILKFFQQQMV